MKYVGHVAQITTRDFAFVFSYETNKRFVHLTNWKGVNPPVVGDEVEFELAPGYKPGLPEQAVNVTPTGRKLPTYVTVRAAKINYGVDAGVSALKTAGAGE